MVLFYFMALSPGAGNFLRLGGHSKEAFLLIPAVTLQS